ncbi:hypothetical protein [Streptomyces sp. NPDC058664]
MGDLVRRFHGVEVDVVWEPPHRDRSWTAQVRVLEQIEKDSPS